MYNNAHNLGKKHSLSSEEDLFDGIYYPNIIHMQKYQLQTFEEARTIAHQLSKHYPSPPQAEIGLNELLLNAIEHGNLNISFQEKQQILQDSTWMDTVYQRLFLAENKKKRVFIQFEKIPGCITVQIKDQGNGFYADNFLNDYPKFTYNGRGIFLAKNYSFDELEYIGNGNHVICRVYTSDSLSWR